MNTFKATHEISLNGGVILVMNVDGIFYTNEEWETCAKAAWERVEGGVLFQGQVPVGEYSIRTLK